MHTVPRMHGGESGTPSAPQPHLQTGDKFTMTSFCTCLPLSPIPHTAWMQWQATISKQNAENPKLQKHENCQSVLLHNYRGPSSAALWRMTCTSTDGNVCSSFRFAAKSPCAAERKPSGLGRCVGFITRAIQVVHSMS